MRSSVTESHPSPGYEVRGSNYPPPLQHPMNRRPQSSIQNYQHRPPNSDMVFLFYLSFLSFFLGYFGAWLTYRAHLPWLVALVYCSILLINLGYTNQAQDQSLLVIILLTSLMLLIARVQLARQLASWTSEG